MNHSSLNCFGLKIMHQVVLTSVTLPLSLDMSWDSAILVKVSLVDAIHTLSDTTGTKGTDQLYSNHDNLPTHSLKGHCQLNYVLFEVRYL